MKIIGIPPQELTQGETYNLNLELPEEKANAIYKMWFTSAKLNICREFIKDGNYFLFSLSHQETTLLNPISTTFNITAQFVGDDEPRALAENISFIVNKNYNPVTCEVQDGNN